ncbi:type I polyketide synthase [Paludisphaera soli]|uniref:type I polyketide synthase n=1 Tax=Paludisphaera soli TaxID=2712865 RepID=UPI001981D75F|nr:type I polyketide synthase [Paludisphaera soli]
MMSNSIALVGVGCEYPDARSPAELWENVLAGRRAFRRMPPERLCMEDYWSADRTAPDRTYAIEAAVIAGYDFDRVGFRVSGESYRAADLAHWLALDVAARALKDAGLEAGDGLPRDATGVFLGNTLTGEFSRAHALRLRWPYTRRVVESALSDEGWTPERRRDFLDRLETSFKAPFPPVGEETLAGGLSNTIAGRICNHFDLKGGGYTVDGACASSLLAVAHACSALAAGDLDAALAGGVDLSLDPFELVGFAKAGALAEELMRVYDARSAGFWPGEGCGVVVLMRLADALAQGRRVVAVIRGWGVSSDGRGGITRPEVEGQLLALRRAYRRAGFGIETVAYFEGHGTGTAVGDATELQALGRALREAGAEPPPAVIGSIKANIGHTKAAAGIAGLIKATAALDAQILPPTTGCERPHPELTGDRPRQCILKKGRIWPSDRPLRAGVSAMGFGGINAHLVLESPAEARRAAVTPREMATLSSPQDAELFLLGGRDDDDLRGRVDHLLSFAHRLSMAELSDLAAHLAGSLDERAVRAAVVAARPAELWARLMALRNGLAGGRREAGEDGLATDLGPPFGYSLGRGLSRPRIAFLFPGQGSPATLDGAAWSRRFSAVEDIYARAGIPAEGGLRSTSSAQPAIVAASLAATALLRELGVEAEIAVGHSLGELSALHWAGAFDADALLRIAKSRGRVMAEVPAGDGAMASLEAEQAEVEALIDGEPVVIAGLNGRRQIVISGTGRSVDAIVARARGRGFAATRLPVSHAFHSPLVAEAVGPLARLLARERFGALQRTVFSTVTGARLGFDVDVPDLLLHQVTAPVRFLEAMVAAMQNVDLAIEVGPGRVLTGLAAGLVAAPVLPVEAGGDSLLGLLSAVGAAFALGAEVRPTALFSGRLSRPFSLAWQPRFFTNPCELAPAPWPAAEDLREPPRVIPVATSAPPSDQALSVLEQVRARVAARIELPTWSVHDGSRLLGDLHMNSITIAQLVAEIASGAGAAPPVDPTAFADATIAEVAAALEELVLARASGRGASSALTYQGVAPWFRAFTSVLVERPRPRGRPDEASGSWRSSASPAREAFAEDVREALSQAHAGCGVVACLPPEPDERHVGLLLHAARTVLSDPEVGRFILVQHHGGASSFARTVQQEIPRLAVCVVDVPDGHPLAVQWVVAEAEAASTPGFTEVHYDPAGRRFQPTLRVLPWDADGGNPHRPLGPSDIILVTGGGKGIAAECGLALARETGARLALLGRSLPLADRDLAANLERMSAAGVAFHYVAADVTDANAVRSAVREIESTLGPITAVVHGAGVNVPRLLASLDEASFLRTLAPKVHGLRNVLATVPGSRLKLLVTFGSLIAKTGMPGEADYAVANEWLARWTERFQAQHPACRCLALEWSVWSGVGMGDRLGGIDAMARRGITAIPPDAGVGLFLRLVSSPQPAVALVVAGRFGTQPILALEGDDLPLMRFLEHPRVSYPGIELVADATISVETDPYLDDHVFRGERLFPAAMGLEAMAQAATAVLGTSELPVFEDVRFDRPIVLPLGQSTDIRVSALVSGPGRVDVVLRCAATAFQFDHFRGTCRFGDAGSGFSASEAGALDQVDDSLSVPIDPETELYGNLLFQSGRFRRVKRYRRLRSTACTAEIAEAQPTEWFGRYLPPGRMLGDPAVRDAAIHAIQCCIPQATLLPVGVDRLVPGAKPLQGPCFVSARERVDEGDLLIYDVDMSDDSGLLLERWEGLRLRVIERGEPQAHWPAPLLGPYLERRMRTLFPGSRIAVEIGRGGGPDRRAQSDRSFRSLIGSSASITRRLDGKPDVAGLGGRGVSTAHSQGLTIATTGLGVVACDLEACTSRPTSLWRDLLGHDRWELSRLVARETGEAVDLAATRSWVAGECLTKAGSPPAAPLVLRTTSPDRVVVLGSGALAIATFALPNREAGGPWVVGLLTREDDARV